MPYSRRVIGWALHRTMEDEITLSALRMALSQRVVEPGLVHHSDRGSQYASGDYTDLLKENGMSSACRATAIRGATRPVNRS
jgi:putative transposase